MVAVVGRVKPCSKTTPENFRVTDLTYLTITVIDKVGKSVESKNFCVCGPLYLYVFR